MGGNNPVNLTDPSGLRPITAAELEAVRKANAPKWGTALAIVASVGLAFVPGCRGFAATLIIGALSSGGGNIMDQMIAGGPVNWGEVGTETFMGALPFDVPGMSKLSKFGLNKLGETPLGRRALGAIEEGVPTPVSFTHDVPMLKPRAVPENQINTLGNVPGPSHVQGVSSVNTLPHELGRADFVADAGGTVIPLSRARLEADLRGAGLHVRETDKPGNLYQYPDGTIVRVMEPNGNAGLRASFTNADGSPISPFAGKPV